MALYWPLWAFMGICFLGLLGYAVVVDAWRKRKE